MKNRAQETRV